MQHNEEIQHSRTEPNSIEGEFPQRVERGSMQILFTASIERSPNEKKDK